MDRRFGDSRAFTLVELMVVVAIIGVLSSIAIPNYQRYQSRSRQSEAKMALSAVYTAEQGFFPEAGTFTLCLRQISGLVQTDMNGNAIPKSYYSTGVSQDLGCGINGTGSCLYYSFSGVSGKALCRDDPTGVDTSSVANAAAFGDMLLNSWGDNNPVFDDTVLNLSYNPYVVKDEFLAISFGSISGLLPDAGRTNPLTGFDIWLIDQNKTLMNIQPGI